MMSKKKEGEAPGPRKTQCSRVGEYQDMEVGRGGLGNRGREEGLYGNFQERGSWKGEII